MNELKIFFAFILILLFASCSSDKPEEAKTEKTADVPSLINDSGWEIYTDTVNAGFIMSFEYPAHMAAQSIQNARCVGEKTTDPEGNIDNMQWCIWMQDAAEFTVQELLKEQRLLFKVKVNEQKDTVMINEKPAIHVKYSEGVSKQIIYMETLGTLFEIVCQGENDKDFERFYKSLRIVKYNPPQ